MGFVRIGDWQKIGTLIANLGGLAKESQQESLKKFGLKVEATAKGHISKQDLGWKELKPATVARKAAKGLSEDVLVETSTYFQSITSYVFGW